MYATKKTCGAAGIAALVLLGGCTMMRETMHSGAGQHLALTGANEVPPVASGASGSGRVHVRADCSVSARVTVMGMAGTAAHIHQGAASANGPVIVPLTRMGDNVFVAPEGAKMTPEQCAAFKAGMTYVNVHSDAHKGGEVRAQLKGS